MAAATCSAVTIEVADKNQAVPRIPTEPGLAFFSSSSKNRVMLTVECVSVAGSTHSAAAWQQNTAKKNRLDIKADAAHSNGAKRRWHRVPATVPPCISPVSPFGPSAEATC